MENARPRMVLVVEDDSIVNWDVAEALRDDGLDALQAYSGEQALDFLAARNDIRVVFTDVNLPGAVDGIALAAAIQKQWPQIEVLLTSAYKRPEIEQLDLVAYYGRFVEKPYPTQAVTRRIHEIVDEAA